MVVFAWSKSRRFLVLGVAVFLSACAIGSRTDDVEPTDHGGGDGDSIDVSGQGGEENNEPPVESVCGNGQLEPGELCDDGGTEDDDGCSADCLDQDVNFDCTIPGQPCINTVVCGNGMLEGSEPCDDGNEVSGDGCNEDCSAVEELFVCPRPGRRCIRLPECGNGIREQGEGCDDGQTTPEDGDGCSAECQLEEGFFCAIPGEPCVEVVCGDGVRTRPEECDDGQDPPLDGDGCSSACTVERGYRCNADGCQSQCGDRYIVGDEECDDGGKESGDGCSGACRLEPFSVCNGEPSICDSTISCGNGAKEPGELCDPPGVDGCLPGCQSFSPTSGQTSVCGNPAIEGNEECDLGAGNNLVENGCTPGCLEVDGWSCPYPGVCFQEPRCGDGILHTDLGEECDDGDMDSSDGCTTACVVSSGFTCVGLGPSICVEEECGDGTRTVSEQCDDNNAIDNDGCSGCLIDPGWACPVEGETCIPRCGDDILSGTEECEDGNTVSGDGCTASCRLELGYACPTIGASCVQAECGNNIVEPGEGCDDGNEIAADGCGPSCQNEPTTTNPTHVPRGGGAPAGPIVNVSCGDGLLTGAEECDDGNMEDGDGCSSTCTEEAGFTCTSTQVNPREVDFMITYRDFLSSNSSYVGGHPDFNYRHQDLDYPEITGEPCTSTNRDSCGRLTTDGVPELVAASNRSRTSIKNADTFGLWFENANPTDIENDSNELIVINPILQPLRLDRVGGVSSDRYEYTSNSFFPLDDLGLGNFGEEQTIYFCGHGGGTDCFQNYTTTDMRPCESWNCQPHNYGFTTELRYFFQYKGGEVLEFSGDDDVWVYVNGHLAVDIGGLHPVRSGRVVLGDDGRNDDGSSAGTDSSCSEHLYPSSSLPSMGGCYNAAEQSSTKDARFDLDEGEVYEIALFQAERHATESNFNLTLEGFLAPRSFCTADCGDGIVVAGEACDNGGANTDSGASGTCTTDCSQVFFCGDGVQQAGEDCDNGENTDLYSATGCAPGCTIPPTCGDGVLQPAYEECDNGGANNNSSYGPTSCTTSCAVGGHCGDGVVNGGEACDDGVNNGTTYGPNSCGFDCQPGPYCGDGVRNGEEQCDAGPGGDEYCSASCTLTPYCGDGIVSEGEECDHGQFASTDHGGCTTSCEWSNICGDGQLDSPEEECDLGAEENDGDYGGCTAECTAGPSCGDGIVQPDEHEFCDNGFNDDYYAFDDTAACGPGCNPVPRCGDGVIELGWELCDLGPANNNDTYNGCTTQCDWGPYCGDGSLQDRDGELCDDGPDNVSYSTDGAACGYDCRWAPYCGDGERNGPEQCDLGESGNDGSYGGCNPDCTLAPRCGDEVVQEDEGEVCDDGPTGSLQCSFECEPRVIVR